MIAGVDTTGWKIKKRAVYKVLATQIPRLLDMATDDVMESTIANLSGPHYKPGKRGPMTGKMPIPRVMSMLVRSIKKQHIDYSSRLVYSDPNVAPYNAAVHNGHRIMHKGVQVGYVKGRDYLGRVIKLKRISLQILWRNTLLNAIRTVGRR